jgi:mRNA interferase MazF
LNVNRKFRCGAVWLANLNPGRGREPGKVRTVPILQNQTLLDAQHPTTLIVPLTTKLTEDAKPLRIRIRAEEGDERHNTC